MLFRSALSELLDIAIGPYVETVTASGPHEGAVSTDKPTNPQQELDAFLGSFMGWTVVG